MPVGGIARQARHLEAHHNPGAAQTHLGDKTLEPQAINRRRAGQAEVRVDYDHLINAPSKSDRALSQVVLALSALGILKQLSQRGLPDIQLGASFQMPGLNFRVRLIGHAITSAVAIAIVATMATRFCSRPTGRFSPLGRAIGTGLNGSNSVTDSIQTAIPLNMNRARPRICVGPPPPGSRT